MEMNELGDRPKAIFSGVISPLFRLWAKNQINVSHISLRLTLNYQFYVIYKREKLKSSQSP